MSEYIKFHGAVYKHVALEGTQTEFPLGASLKKKILHLRYELAQAAQKVVDDWQQDEDGIDCELGSGGACDQVADALGDVLAKHGIDTVPAGADGDDHAWLLAYDTSTNEVVEVDIPPYVYESGGGYSWKKRQDVTIAPDDVSVVVVRNINAKDLEASL